MAERPPAIFVDGSSVKDPHPNSPEWVIMNLSFGVEKLIEQLKKYPYKYIDMTVKAKKAGGMYLEVNEYGKLPEHMRDGFKEGAEPEETPSSSVADVFGEDKSDVPF